MDALILNGERKGESALSLLHEVIVHTLSSKGWHVETILLRDEKIARCTGCFGCWTKTPGVCVIDDFGREVARKVIQSDLIVYLTPVTFGGYSSELKKAVDRFACSMLLPFFTKIDGEVHHKARYSPLPGLIGIGVLPRPDKESERIFAKLVARNAVNLHSPAAPSAVYYSSQSRGQIEEGVCSLLGNLKT
jgi:hypothetical protein